MNLLNVDPPENKDGYEVKDFRTLDYVRIFSSINEMCENLRKIDPKFSFVTKITQKNSKYLYDWETYLKEIRIEMTYTDTEAIHTKTQIFNVPSLIHKNFFVLGGNIYVPSLFLERNLIESIGSKTKETPKQESLDEFINLDIEPQQEDNVVIALKLNHNVQLYFKFETNKVFLRDGINVPIDVFINIMLEGTEELDRIVDNHGIRKLNIKKSKDLQQYVEVVQKILKSLNLSHKNFFKTKNDHGKELRYFFDNYIILNMYKEIFYKKYEFDRSESLFVEIIREVFRLKSSGVKLDMSDINNRRVVFAEYLLAPVIGWYLRNLSNIHNKMPNQNWFAGVDVDVIQNTGFRGIMHAKNLYDISLPYPLPIINKISQNITIVAADKVPKSWTSNHISAFGKICPISVSAQNMGASLVLTSSTLVDSTGGFL